MRLIIAVPIPVVVGAIIITIVLYGGVVPPEDIGVGNRQHPGSLTIYAVENNPPGTDSGNEWLTIINTGGYDTFDGYEIRTTHGRIAHYNIPTITLDMCEYHKITFPKQAIDNEDDTVKLRKDGVVIYQTPVIRDTGNDGYFWTNPDAAAVCGGM